MDAYMRYHMLREGEEYLFPEEDEVPNKTKVSSKGEIKKEFKSPYHEEAMRIMRMDLDRERLSPLNINRYHEMRWMHYLFKGLHEEDSKKGERFFRKLDNSVLCSVPLFG